MSRKGTKSETIKRPHMDAIVRDPNLRMSFETVQSMRTLSPEQREQVLRPFIVEKLNRLIEIEGIGTSKTLSEQGDKVVSLLCEHLFFAHMLPEIGEKASVKAYLKKFQKLAAGLNTHLAEHNWSLIWALSPATDFQTALIQTYNLNMSLQKALEASAAAYKVLNLNQLSTFENGKQKLAWSLAEIMDKAGEEVRSTSTGLYGRLLRVCLCTLFGVADDEMLDTSRLAKNVIRQRARDAV